MVSDYKIQHITIDGTNYVLSAGTSDVNSGAIDLQGSHEVTLVLTVGTISPSGTVDAKLQHSTDNSTWADVASSAHTQITATDDDKVLAWQVKEPTRRYLRVAITRGDGGNSVIENLLAFVKVRTAPFTQATTAGQHMAAPKRVLGVSGTA